MPKNEHEIKAVKSMVFAIQKGDRSKLEKLLDDFNPLIISLANKYVHAQISYDDILQQARLSFIESVYNYDEAYSDNPITHIVSRTKWSTFNYYKREVKNSDRELLVEETDTFSRCDTDGGEHFSSEAEDIEWIVLNKIDIEEKLNLLNEREREVYELYVEGSLTQKDVADVMGVSQPTIHRVLNSIRSKFNL